MAGASGYVLKQVRSGELVRAIRAVGDGESLLDPSVTTAVLDRLRKGKHLMRDEKLARLSPQEERVLTLIAEGRTNKEVGDELHLAEKTVKNYVSSILSKLEVARRAEAAAYLARHTTLPGSIGVIGGPHLPPIYAATADSRGHQLVHHSPTSCVVPPDPRKGGWRDVVGDGKHRLTKEGARSGRRRSASSAIVR
jgi:DNA-binding CsgD family transcriptional regulator